MGKGHVSVVSRPGTKQLSRKCWLVNNEGTLPSAGCPHLLHQLTGWWFLALWIPLLSQKENLCSQLKSKGTSFPRRRPFFLDPWTPALLGPDSLNKPFVPAALPAVPSQPLFLGSANQNTLLPLATSLPEAATPLWQRLSLAKPESGSSEPSSFLILDLGLVLDLRSPVLTGFCRISLAKISPPSMSDHPGYLIKLFTPHFWYLLTLAHLQQESC